MLSKRLPLVLALTILLALLFAIPVAADDGVTDDQINAIASQLYCPVCENIPLDTCPTQACVQWRQVIHDKLAAGWSEAEIKTYFVDQYGDRVLAEPPARGFNWLIYVLPPMVFLAGAYALIRVLKAWQKAPQETAAALGPAANRDPYIERLEEELRKRA